MDLIERSEAVDLVRKMQTYKLSADANFLLIDQAEAMTELMMLPSAQPERKMGHWEDVHHKSVEHGEVVVDGKTVRCSVCRHTEKGWNKGMNYCPECGAKMIQAKGKERWDG